MTTQSSQTPSSLLCATKASSARIRSSQRLKERAEADNGVSCAVGSETVDSLEGNESGAKALATAKPATGNESFQASDSVDASGTKCDSVTEAGAVAVNAPSTEAETLVAAPKVVVPADAEPTTGASEASSTNAASTTDVDADAPSPAAANASFATLLANGSPPAACAKANVKATDVDANASSAAVVKTVKALASTGPTSSRVATLNASDPTGAEADSPLKAKPTPTAVAVGASVADREAMPATDPQATDTLAAEALVS